MQDFELIIDPPVEADTSAYRASLAAAMAQVAPRPSLPALGAGYVVAHASFVAHNGAPRGGPQPRGSLAPGGLSVNASASVAAIRASLAPPARAPRVSLTPPPPTNSYAPPPRGSLTPPPAHNYAPPSRASRSTPPPGYGQSAPRPSLVPSPHSSLVPSPQASLAPARPTLVPQPSQPPRMPRDRAAAAMVLASFAPPPRVSWAPSAPGEAQQREQTLARLCEDLVTARLIAVVPRTHARAVLAALAPLDRGLVGASLAMLEIYAEVGAPHLVQVAHGLAELAAQHGRLQAASDIYRALYQATGDADFEIRAADALSMAV